MAARLKFTSEAYAFVKSAAARHGGRRELRWPRGGTQAEQLLFAGIPVRLRDEAKHFKVLGTTGTGKSTAIGELLARALERGDRAVSPIPKGAIGLDSSIVTAATSC